MKLYLYLFTQHKGCEHPQNDPLCSEIFQGVFDAEESIFGTYNNPDRFGGLTIKLFNPKEEEQKILSINQIPSLVFYDAEKGMAVQKLVGSKVDYARVREVAEFLFDLEPDPDGTGGYVSYSTGNAYGVEDIIDMRGTGGWGMGLGLGNIFGGCPKWMPKVICNFPFWIFTVMLIAIALLLILKLRR